MVTETYKDARTGEMRTRSYVRGRPLGKGGFAVVFSMQDPSTGESFAAKVVAKSTLEKDRARQKILTEIRIHRSVDNAHVVKFKKCFEDTNNVYILMELCSDKTLADVVKRRGRLTERECAPYLREIVAAVAHLHRERNVIHRDLKLGNVFLTPAGLDEASNDKEGGPGSDADLGANPRFGTRLKIGDFGLACVAASGGDKKLTICGTPNYIAPETLAGSKGGGHSSEVDVWSIGVILYACLVGTPPFQTSDVRATYKRIRAGAYEFPKKDDGSGEHLLSSDARELIAACLAPKPRDRPSLETIANHPTCRLGAPEWRLPQVSAAKKTDGGGADDDAAAAAAAERAPRVSPRAAALLAAGVADAYPPTPVSGESKQAPRAPLSPLPANLPARAAGRLKARGESLSEKSEKSERRAAPALAPPAQPAAFDVLEAQDVRAFDEHHSRRSDANRSGRANPKPRRAAEEGAPRSNAAGKTSAPSVPSAPPASPSRRNVTVTSVSGRDAVGIPTSSLISVRAAPSAAALMSAGAESSSSLADDDEDVGARVADCIGGGDSAGAAERRRAASASAANVASIATFPPVWVTKWVDYTSKYGLGYRLSDGTFGVVFNDATKMSQASPSLTEKTDAENEDGVASASLPPSEVSPRSKDTTARVTPPGDRLEYRERARRGSGSNPEPPGAPCVAFSAAAPPPSGLEKKTKLMRHFRGYLARDGRSAVERSAGGLFETDGRVVRTDNGSPSIRRGGDERENEEDVLPRAAAETARAAAAARARDSSRRASVSAYLPHVKNWLRTKHAILFRLSNRTIQVNFTDGSEILLSSEAQACVFVDPKTGKRDAHLLAKLPADPELLRRLRYVKEVLHQLVHRAE